MKFSPEIRVGSLRLVFALAGLALLIFLWGLAYKLSLYEPAQTSMHHIPQAKLLSENERPDVADVSPSYGALGPLASGLPLAFFYGGLLLAGYMFACRAPRNHGSPVRATRNCTPFASTISFSAILFRPPPILC